MVFKFLRFPPTVDITKCLSPKTAKLAKLFFCRQRATEYTDRNEIWQVSVYHGSAIAYPRCRLMCRISSRSVYSVAFWRRKPQFLPFFGLRHLVVLPIGSSLRKLNTGAQLQTFPYPTSDVIKIVSLLQRLHGEIGRTNLDVQKRDGQTDRQTDKKLNVFGCPAAGEIRAPPILAR